MKVQIRALRGNQIKLNKTSEFMSNEWDVQITDCWAMLQTEQIDTIEVKRIDESTRAITNIVKNFMGATQS